MSDHDHVSDEEMVNATNPAVGDGSPETAPDVEPEASLLDREPWMVALVLALLPALGSLVQAALDGEPIRAGISAFVALAIPAIVSALREKTTPIADPKLSREVRLVPADRV